MSISIDEVRHVARLARLDLDDAEILALQGELNSLLGHFSDMQVVDTSGLDPQSHAVALVNAWAEDVMGFCLPREEALRSSALTRAGLFVVPTIIED